MSNIKIEFNDDALEKVAKQAVNKWASERQDKCFFCGKPLQPNPALKPNQVPVCAECARKHQQD
ncbi:hypothetical protein [Bifidobacterium sp. ESL0745]|uniref:hypothetical protein n=1 Tax=Bifidobacterium sp. ESL0745 TaxID=2983226 RepID=UPI0023F8D22B|nr:hypothetical protein [Bifidobacterium sp. ESL0745]MDF7665717.1 hypothetical protein [Bifidobacterium sp. ESL0745]